MEQSQYIDTVCMNDEGLELFDMLIDAENSVYTTYTTGEE